MEYKELYSFLLRCFTEADTDCDGKISAEAFDALIDVAAKAPRKFGFAPPASETYKNAAEKTAARKVMFEKVMILEETEHPLNVAAAESDREAFVTFIKR